MGLFKSFVSQTRKPEGLDYSELSVEKAKDYNKDMIAAGLILRVSRSKRSLTA